MTTLGRNVAANIAGAVFLGVATLAVVPLYLRWLGADAYGLIGFHMALQGLLILFDLGLSVGINRELALLSATAEGMTSVRGVIHTGLRLYGAAAIGLALLMSAFAPLIAARWVETTTIFQPVVVTCLRLMSVALAAQFVALLYSAGFLGLQRQVLHSALTSSTVLLRFGGGAVVAFVTHDIRAFFAWQAVAGLFQLLAMAVALERVLPARRAEARFDPRWLRNAWSLARGVAVVSAMAAVTTQGDKFAVSRASALAVFGYYTAATVLAMAAAGGAAPVASAVFPRFAQLLALDEREELSLAYHRAVQAMAAIVLPVACVLAIWSREVVFVWTGDPVLASGARILTVLLVAGTAMNGLLNVPYMLQLAHGWTTPATIMNGAALVTFVPAMFVAAALLGPIGAATVFAAMHASFLVCGVVVTQSRLLTQSSRWSFLRDTAPAALAASGLAVAGRFLFPVGLGRIETTLALAVVGIAAFGGAVLVTPAVREWIGGQWPGRRTSA
ncbi:MAG: oligosaccharide flippase family protein [Acidobacteriota bacterium]